jgi:hypothetical protein
VYAVPLLLWSERGLGVGFVSGTAPNPGGKQPSKRVFSSILESILESGVISRVYLVSTRLPSYLIKFVWVHYASFRRKDLRLGVEQEMNFVLDVFSHIFSEILVPVR